MSTVAKLIIALIICVPMAASAMPPHPKVVKEWKDKGIYAQKMQARSARKALGIDKPVKAFPTTGATVKVCVLMVQFSGGSAQVPPVFPRNPFVPIILIVLIAGSASLVIKIRKHRVAMLFISTLVLPIALISMPGCGGGGSGGGKFSSESTPAMYETLFNGATPSSLSWTKYYQDMSDNTLNLQFDVYGPYTASKSHDYYGRNDGSGNDMHPEELAEEAVDQANASVDFSQYDNDHNGSVDGLVIIHQGSGEEAGGPETDIWSHSWAISKNCDGVSISDYAMQPEYVFEPGDSTIGVFCHEFGHMLGLPDLYDTTYTTNGVGEWSLMAAGSWNGPVNSMGYTDGAVPAPLLGWERDLLGWITVNTYGSGSGPNTVNDINAPPREISKFMLLDDIAGTDYDQYLLVENIVHTDGTWTEYLPGYGLLFTVIDNCWITTNGIPYNAVNCGTTYPHGVRIIEAHGGINNLLAPRSVPGSGSNTGDSGDTFPYGGNSPNTNYQYYNAAHTTFTTPLYNESSGLSITGIPAKSSSMMFNFNYSIP
jgi:immune inhibitor A